MLTVEIVIKQDGHEVARLPADLTKSADALINQQYKVQPDFPIHEGTRNWWGFTFVPMVTVKLVPNR